MNNSQFIIPIIYILGKTGVDSKVIRPLQNRDFKDEICLRNLKRGKKNKERPGKRE